MASFATLFRISDEDLRDFFPLPRVITGIFRLVQNLFDVIIEEVGMDKESKNSAQVKTWSPGVKLFKVSDGETRKELGHFYFDPYIR